MDPRLLWLLPLLPFTGFLLNGTLGRRLPRAAVTGIALLFTAVPAAMVAWLWATLDLAAAPIELVSRPWIQVPGFTVNFAFTIDHLTLIMLSVVTGVGFLIHVYSAGYMAHEEGFWRFFAYLNLFMFFMSVLVLSANFLLLFVGWEGVGLASYLLIGFYFHKKSAANAGKKAFIVNRIGDFGFLLAMFLLIAHFGTLSFKEIFASIMAHPAATNPGWQGGFLTAIALLLIVGAAGKSAQIPLYVWLPDAMEGPTPVSALIHAATMVTAGVYLVARCHVLFDRSPFALGVVAVIGALTALFAASVGIVQHDIKRVLAYSTISQLGYMFLGCGVAAYSAAVFHLVTHAFFKALLFLAAGSVIHALSGEQDMRVMGGLRKRIPITFWSMTMGVLAIAGIYPFSGFFSKDEILYRTFASPNPLGKLLWAVGLITAGMTAFYMFRLWFKTFFGAPRFDEHALGAAHAVAHGTAAAPGAAEHDEGQVAQGGSHNAHGVHESPWSMLLPLVILAVLSLAGGWMGVPQALGGSNHFEHFLDPVFAATSHPENALNADQVSHGMEQVLAGVSLLTAFAGFGLAWLCYWKRPGTASALATKVRPLYQLVAGKYFVDEIYDAIFVTGLLAATRGLLSGIGEFLVNGFATLSTWIAVDLGEAARRVQSGNLRSYAGWLALGAAAVMAVMVFGRQIWMH